MEKNINDGCLIVLPCLNMGGLDRKKECIASGVKRGTRKVQALQQLHAPGKGESGERIGQFELCGEIGSCKGDENNKFRIGLPFRENQEHGGYNGVRHNRHIEEICERPELPFFRETA